MRDICFNGLVEYVAATLLPVFLVDFLQRYCNYVAFIRLPTSWYYQMNVL
jgi:hypothetical protein